MDLLVGEHTMANLQITIDDGPLPMGALTAMLDELKTRSVVAGFFILGEEVKKSPQSTMLIKKAKHVLGNHSWDHLMPRTQRFTDAQIVKQFEDTHAEILKATSIVVKHWRAPRLEQIARIAGLIVGPNRLYTMSHNDVNADSKDSQSANDAKSMLMALRNDIKSQSARTTFRLLFHVKDTTAKAFKSVLDGLVADGHTLVDFAQSK